MTKKDLLHNLGVAAGALHNILADLSCLHGGMLKKALKARRLVMALKDLVDQKITDDALASVAEGWQLLAKREEEKRAFEVWKAKHYEERWAKSKALVDSINARVEAQKGTVAE